MSTLTIFCGDLTFYGMSWSPGFFLFTPMTSKSECTLITAKKLYHFLVNKLALVLPFLKRGVDLMSTLYSFCFIFVCWGSVLKQSIDLNSTFYRSWFCIFYLYYILYLFINVNTDSMNVYLNICWTQFTSGIENLIFFNRQGFLDHIVPYCRRWCSFFPAL